MQEEEIKTGENIKKEFFTVPLEVLIDIFKILFDNKIKHRVESIRERENCVCIEALIDSNQTIHVKALENITDTLGYFGHYLHEGLNNEFS
jgi:transcriptional regulator of met regulon